MGAGMPCTPAPIANLVRYVIPLSAAPCPLARQQVTHLVGCKLKRPIKLNGRGLHRCSIASSRDRRRSSLRARSICRCTLFGALGVLVQLLLESKKRKKQNLKKAAEIRQETSTADEVERARAVIDDLDSMPAEEKEPSNASSVTGAENDPDFQTINLDDIADIDEFDEE